MKNEYQFELLHVFFNLVKSVSFYVKLILPLEL